MDNDDVPGEKQVEMVEAGPAERDALSDGQADGGARVPLLMADETGRRE